MTSYCDALVANLFLANKARRTLGAQHKCNKMQLFVDLKEHIVQTQFKILSYTSRNIGQQYIVSICSALDTTTI